MDVIKEYLDYIEEIRNDAMISSSDSGFEFVRRTLELFALNGAMIDPVQFYFGKPGKRGRIMQIDGYSFDDADNTMTFVISDFVDSLELNMLNNTQVEALFNKIYFFLDEVCNGRIEDYCDDSDDTIKLAKLIKYKLSNDVAGEAISKIKFLIITNKKISNSVKKLKSSSINNFIIETQIWDFERIYNDETKNENEIILIDLKNDFGHNGIPCVKVDIGDGLGFDAYTAVMPGYLLSSIYLEYGSKVLEGNVRAFLGTSGNKSVNSGIKKTIIEEPEKFFIYNNGIATTAASVELEERDGNLFITKIEDLQIINGGQTTASLLYTRQNPPKGMTKALVEEKLKQIYVPMKLTVISDRESVDENDLRTYDYMVQKISRYANTQNPVKAADFFSNSPFHIYMEKLSKKHLAPPTNGSPIPTGWYYERARKKYQQEQIKMSESDKKRFQEKFPSKGRKSQLVTKEMFAKCIYCVEQKPHIVSKGNNWIMKEFGEIINEKVKKDQTFINEYYFKTSIAKVILFKTVDEIVNSAPWYVKGGYKLNIVPYTIAKIIYSIPNGYSLDWMKIWNNQSLMPSLIREIEKVAKLTNDFITNSSGMIVTEYCKKADTWDKYKNIPYQISAELLKDLISNELVESEERDAMKTLKEETKINYEIEVYKIGSANWLKYFEFGRDSKLLNSKELSILSIAVDMERTGRTPSTKQAEVILQIKKKLENEGFNIQ